MSELLLTDFQQLFESMPALYLVLTPDLVIVAVTDAYLQATMTQRQQVLGRPLFEIFPDNPDDPHASGTQNLRASLNRVRRDGVADTMSVQKYDIRRPEAEGGGYEERFWSPINSPLFNAQGQLQYIIHRVEDVTGFIQLKQRGSENEKLTTELRTLVEKTEVEVYLRAQEVSEVNRRLHTANAELAHMNERMQELDQIKTQFFANVSHELRTPLTLILSPTKSLLALTHLDEHMRRQLLVIERNSHLLLKHVNDLLDVAKLEAGKMDLHVASTNLGQLLERVASYFDVLADEKSIHYIVETEQGVLAQVDSAQIERVFLNMLSNAFKFTPAKGQIRCCLHADHEQRHVLIDIADSGIGVQIEQRESIFEAFHQANTGLNRHFAGTGLGLSIAREFAELHGGTLSVSNAPEGGALFRLILPILAIEEPLAPVVTVDDHTISNALAEFSSSQTEVTVIQQLTEGALVLVIEDNVELNQFLCDSLVSDYRIASALNGEEGLQKIELLRPDLILCDVMMPKMSGDMLVQQVRANVALNTIPILLLSAKADDDFRIQLLKAGAQDYLIKPFLLDELRARVRNLVNAKLAEDHNRQLTIDLEERHHRLQQLMSELEEANKELESFSYSVSHDLRSPLRAIDGFSHLLAQRAANKLDAEEQRLLMVVRNNSKKMGQLIDDLLHFSRVSRVGLRRYPTDMNALVEEVWKEIKEDYQGSIVIGSLPIANIDRALLAQVWTNLLVNAVKYSAKVAHPTITVSADSGETEYCYHVHDNGAGFDMRFVHKLFVVFQRLHSDAEFSGTGVGLAIVARIINRHGGRVWAQGEVDKGATIHFTIPKT
ncbi:MAG: ATP-binding protein [Agitococcus sp.]|nr:ATP-binding protein [Agitococcus sp.]